MSTKLPTYFKNEDGFCYTATETLATLEGMTPWDGEVDERGFAVEAAAEVSAPEKPAKTKGKNKPAEVEPEPAPADEPPPEAE